MSDPIDALAGLRKRDLDPPDSPRSVGWTHPQRVLLADAERPLPLACGRDFWPITLEYEMYGELSAARDNVILIFHALSGDAHVAGWDADWQRDQRPWRAYPDGRSPNWWDRMVGPGKALDTSQYCVLCANVLGSCYGTTGPSSTDPRADGRPFGLRFPPVVVGDWVRLVVRLLDHLGIAQVRLAVGGSLGGQQVIELGLAYPERARGLAVLAASPRLSNQGVALNYAARQAIMNDPHFAGGDYYDGQPPAAGLGIARMIGHITYLSEGGMESRFDPLRKPPADLRCGSFDPHGRLPRPNGGLITDNEYEVESYLTRQALGFNERFDANSYLYITKAMDYYDAADWGRGDLETALARARGEWLVASFTSDWLYTPAACRRLADALCVGRKPVTYINIESSYGHDAFLLEVEVLERLLTGFLEGLA